MTTSRTRALLNEHILWLPERLMERPAALVGAKVVSHANDPICRRNRVYAPHGLDAAELTAPVVEEFFAARRAAGHVMLRSPRALEPLLAFLREQGVEPALVVVAATPAEEELERYRRYLLGERGLAAGTVRGYVDIVGPFLAGQVAAEGSGLEHLAAREVSAYVLAECPGRSRGSAKLLVTALRSLLGFLHVEGVLAESLSGAVPSVAGWRLAGLPRGLEPGQARRLLTVAIAARRLGGAISRS